MPSRRQTSVCREGWYLLLLLVAVFAWALLRENNLLLLAAGLMAGTLLIDWRMSVAILRHLEVHRRIVSSGHAGSWLWVEIEVRNGRRNLGSWAVVVEDCVARKVGRTEDRLLRPRLLFSYVPAAQAVKRTYRLRLPQRGPYVLGPLRVSTRFPLGLVGQSVWLDSHDELLVLPRLGQLRPAWFQHCPPVQHGSRGARRPGYVPGDFFAVREWQPGDSVRWVHWRSTARHRQLVVRQFEQPGERQLAVLLDLWQPEVPSPEHAERIELAVSFAATLIADFRHQPGPALLAIAAARPVFLAGRAAGPFSREAQLSLAMAQAAVSTPLAKLWQEVLRRIGPQGQLIVISTRPDVEAAVPEFALTPGTISGAGPGYRMVSLHDGGSLLAKHFEIERGSGAEDAP